MMAHNATWMIVCKALQSLVQMVLGMITARYLGPSDYGLISYAAAVTAFAVPFMRLGLDETLVREYVAEPDREGEIASTALVMNGLSGLACMVCVILFVSAANAGEPVTILVCGLYSLSLLFQAVEMMQYWFHARLLSRYASGAMLMAYGIVAVYRILLLILRKSVYWFAVVHCLEYALTGAVLLVVYSGQKGKLRRPSLRMAKRLFSRSRYYILAGLMVTVFHNTDHIMLKLMLGDGANGYYTAAVTCTIVVSFVYNAVIDAWRPVILKHHGRGDGEFQRHLVCLYAVMICMTLLQAVCFTVLGRILVLFLYGSAYLPAVPVLWILVWMQPFSYMGTIRNIWILAEEQHSLLWKINLCGAVANVGLNGLLIPVWGAGGAAAASVVTQVFTNVIVGFFFRPIRENNRLLLKGMHPAHLREAWVIWKEKK